MIWNKPKHIWQWFSLISPGAASVFFTAMGKALPKDSFLLVPFNCDVVVGETLSWTGSVESFMETLQSAMTGLAGQIHMVPWD